MQTYLIEARLANGSKWYEWEIKASSPGLALGAFIVDHPGMIARVAGVVENKIS